ncbi:MAG: hypothetical protein DRJ10_16755, partial [Bacteroidetes bacterium]
QDYLSSVKLSGEDLLIIINDILDFSKIEAGQLQIEEIPFSLRLQIENVFKMLQLKADEKSIGLILDIKDNVPKYVNSDPIRIKQIIINLLNNAIKFTEKGNVKLEVSIDNENETDLLICFKIIDTGIGIDEHKMDNMFAEFTQADTSTTRKHGGTGLGLTISKKLSELMGGEIGLESEVGTGSTFWFTIKTTISDKPTNNEFVDETVELPSGIKILLAEDNLINQKVSSIMIKQIGYECDIAANGEEAYTMHLKNNYDVIFMDILMPVMDGMEATSKIREWETNNKASNKCIIIAQTANAFKEDINNYLNNGMDYYVGKPLRTRDLTNVLLQIYK